MVKKTVKKSQQSTVTADPSESRRDLYSVLPRARVVGDRILRKKSLEEQVVDETSG